MWLAGWRELSVMGIRIGVTYRNTAATAPGNTSGQIAKYRQDLATLIVGVLALDQVMGFELMIPGQVFGMVTLAAAELGAAGRNGDPSGPARI
jgi:hypothetical protein